MNILYIVSCASQQISFAASINLKANVESDMHSTVFPYYDGKIISVNPFTEFTGFTLGFDWNQTNIGSKISSNGESFDAWANGQLDYYLLIDGFIKLYSQSVSISGTVSVF